MPYNLKKLNTNIVLNGLKNVTIFPIGLGNKEDFAKMNIAKEDSYFLGNSSLIENEKISGLRTQGVMQEIQVKIKRLDDVVQEIGIKELALVKIDVEGYEIEVLKGASNTIKTFKPVIVMEYYQKRLRHLKINESQFQEILTPYYDCYEILGKTSLEDHFSLEPYHFDRTMKFANLLCIPRP